MTRPARPAPSEEGAGQVRWLAVPLLFAAYPLLSFYQHNIDQMTAGELLAGVAVSVAVVAAVTGAVFALLRRPEATAVLVSAAAVAFFTYGHVHVLLVNAGLEYDTKMLGVGVTTALLESAGYALALAAVTFAVLSRRLPVRETVRILAVLGGVLLISTSVMTVSAVSAISTAEKASPRAARPAEPAKGASKEQSGTGDVRAQDPDIYYIILDMYQGKETLRELTGYDNSAFYDALGERGFFVAEDSYANYVRTYLALGSTLKMGYLQDYTDLPEYRKRKGRGLNRGVFYKLVHDNETIHMLKERGYEYVHMESGWGATSKAPLADSLITLEQQPEWAVVFLKTTWAMDTVLARDNSVRRARVERGFDALDPARDADRPVFVFAHFVLPHYPYIFAADGSDPRYDQDRIEKDPAAEQKAYLEQLRYVNELVLAHVGDLTEERGRPVVVILQGDHGTDFAKLDGSDGPGDAERRRHATLNAMYFSDGRPEELTSTTSPVNTFRIVSDRYFGTDLGLLPDRSFYCGPWPYWPKEVTEEIRAAGRP